MNTTNTSVICEYVMLSWCNCLGKSHSTYTIRWARDSCRKLRRKTKMPNPLARVTDTGPSHDGMIYRSRAPRGDHQSVDGRRPAKIPLFCLSRSTTTTNTAAASPPDKSIIAMITIIICKQTPTRRPSVRRQ
jgi:hypothetical protein